MYYIDLLILIEIKKKSFEHNRGKLGFAYLLVIFVILKQVQEYKGESLMLC